MRKYPGRFEARATIYIEFKDKGVLKKKDEKKPHRTISQAPETIANLSLLQPSRLLPLVPKVYLRESSCLRKGRGMPVPVPLLSPSLFPSTPGPDVGCITPLSVEH